MSPRHPALALAALLLASACASDGPPPAPAQAAKRGEGERSFHIVRAGETVWRISKWYGTTVDAIVTANRLADPTEINVGQMLIIPPRTRRPMRHLPETWTRSDPRGKSAKPRLAWPVNGKVTSGFGVRNGAHHDGIDIPARPGTPIRAAEAGRVVHDGSKLAGYGNMIILKHAGRLSTVYAHNRKNLVRVGEFVQKGQVIAEVGSTGRTSAPHVHFEVRGDGRPRNPLNYLP